MYFGKAVSDFNQSIQGQGTNGPQLIANTGNAFTSESFVPASDVTAHLKPSGLGWLFFLRHSGDCFVGKITCPCNQMIDGNRNYFLLSA